MMFSIMHDEYLRGPTSEILPLGLELTDFSSLRIRKPSFIKCPRAVFQVFARIISLVFLIVETFIEVEGILSLRMLLKS